MALNLTVRDLGNSQFFWDGANSCVEKIWEAKVEVPTADLKELLAALTEVSINLAGLKQQPEAKIKDSEK